MAVRQIIEDIAEDTGWDEESIIEILCDYIDNQQSDDVFEEYVTQRAEEEMNG